MQTPQFVDGQFVDGTLLNSAVTQLMQNFEMIGSELHTPGLLNPSALVFTPSALTVQVQAPSPFAVLFSSGLVVSANGIASGAVSSTYSINCASLVPASGVGSTVYIVAKYGEIGQQQIQVVGPPEGHPDFDPTFAPFQWYMEAQDTLAISATLNGPDNITSFELAHFTLVPGQATITPGSITSTWHYASAVLNPTGITPGSYPAATITVSGDGRVTSIASGAYGLLFGANEWRQPNLFDQPITVKDPSNGGLIVSGNATLGANILLLGNGTATPNKYIRAIGGIFQILSNSYATAILTLSDTGSLSVPLGIVAGATVQGAALSTIGGVTAGSVNSTGAVSAGTTVTAQGAMQAGTTINAGTSLTANNGNVLANNGRLRASFGAKNSNDPNAATLLNDFALSFIQQDVMSMFFPNNFGIQVTSVAISSPLGGGLTSQLVFLPNSFPTNIAAAFVGFLGNTPPQDVGLAAQPNSPNSVLVTVNASPTAGLGPYGIVVVAFGF